MKNSEATHQAIYSKVKQIEAFENMKPSPLDSPMISIALFVVFIMVVLFLPDISGKEAIYFFIPITSILLIGSHERNKQLHKKVDLLFEIVKAEASSTAKIQNNDNNPL